MQPDVPCLEKQPLHLLYEPPKQPMHDDEVRPLEHFAPHLAIFPPHFHLLQP